MIRFQQKDAYETTLRNGYKLLPFKFTKLRGNDYVATNLAGEYVVLSRSTIQKLVELGLEPSSEEYKTLKVKHFLIDEDSGIAPELLALKWRTKLAGLSDFTSLHMMVVTLRCEHSCPYCQVSRRSNDKTAFDMSMETAVKSLDLIFKSPSPHLKIEFQGGEPLINFQLIRFIVEQARRRNESLKKDLQFVVATNLALIDSEILEFCRTHRILISTSLDGPKALHNKNRPRPGGNSHEKATDGIRLAMAELGKDYVSALMTTTKESLTQVENIVDEYIRLGLGGIFLRPMSPYGFAMKTNSYAAYKDEEWLEFYFKGLDYIIGINLDGFRFVEHYASLVLTKMLTPYSTGYVDLMNPSGIGIAAAVYNYDGGVYASDEGRMLAEMGDRKFLLGNVHTNSYREIFSSETLLEPLESSFTSSVPMCGECAFESYCGAEPVFHYATQGDFVGHKPTSKFCNRNMAIFRRLISLMEDDPKIKDVFLSWIRT